MQECVAQPLALRRAHRAVVEIEREIADLTLLRIDDLAEGAMIVGRVDRQRRLGHAAKRRSQDLCRGQFDPGDRAEVRVAKLAAEARAGKVAMSPPARSASSLAFRWEIQTAPSTVPMQIAPSRRARTWPGGPLEAVLVMRAIEEAASSEQSAEDAGRAVRRADLPTIVSALSRVQSMARSACFIGGRRRPLARGNTSDSFSGCHDPDLNSPDSIRSTASRTPRKAASVTGPR